MQFKNTASQYGFIAVFFHWLIALLVIFMLALGLYMTSLASGPTKTAYFGVHKGTGILILFLMILRLLWRFRSITPSLAYLPIWERWFAKTIHGIFYTWLFAMPITGWLTSSAGGNPVSFFNLFILPKLVDTNQHANRVFATIHTWLAYILIAIIVLHISAALKHHFIDKDNTLSRML